MDQLAFTPESVLPTLLVSINSPIRIQTESSVISKLIKLYSNPKREHVLLELPETETNIQVGEKIIGE
jgi:hypothetical protein